MVVRVGSAVPPTAGSSVRTLAKLLPETVPWLETVWPPVYGLLTVGWNLMGMPWPACTVPRPMPLMLVAVKVAEDRALTVRLYARLPVNGPVPVLESVACTVKLNGEPLAVVGTPLRTPALDSVTPA